MTQVVIPYSPRYPQDIIHQGMDGYRFSVVVAHRRLGKTVAVINQLVKWAATCQRPLPFCAYIAPQLNQAKQIAWAYLTKYTAPFPGVKRNESELFVQLPNKAKIQIFGADNPDRLRGLYFDAVSLDEVAQMKPEVWGEIIRPALADREGKAVFIGTPKGINLFHEMYQRAASDPTWFLGVYRADETGVLSAEELAQARASMSDAQYRQEFLCDFSASSEDILIPLDVVLAAAKKRYEFKTIAHAAIVMGVDVARFGDDKSVVISRQGLSVIDIKKYAKMDLMTLAARVSGDIERLSPQTVFIDSIGVGAGLVDRLRQLGRSVIEVNAGSSSDMPHAKNKRSEMWVAMRDWLHSGGAIPNDQELIAQLSCVEYKYDANDRIQLARKDEIKKDGMPSPDIADALALTFAYPVAKEYRKSTLQADRLIDRVTKPQIDTWGAYANAELQKTERWLRQLTSGDPYDDDYGMPVGGL